MSKQSDLDKGIKIGKEIAEKDKQIEEFKKRLEKRIQEDKDVVVSVEGKQQVNKKPNKLVEWLEPVVKEHGLPKTMLLAVTSIFIIYVVIMFLMNII